MFLKNDNDYNSGSKKAKPDFLDNEFGVAKYNIYSISFFRKFFLKLRQKSTIID